MPRAYWVSLHHGAPGSAQSEREADYPGYRRQLLPANGDHLGQACVTFPVAPFGLSAPLTHLAIGSSETGPGQVLKQAELGNPLRLTPRHAALNIAPCVMIA